MKNNKSKLVLTTFVTILPIIAGLIIWNKLPDVIPTHFDSNGVANGWSGKAFTVFGIPLILAGLHLICIFASAADPKFKNIGILPMNLIFWIIPAVSLFVFSVIYGSVLGIKMKIGFYCNIFIGILFIIFGYVLRSVKQNYTFGIKLPWTLNNEENWNKTNRLAGICTAISGIIIIALSFLEKLNLTLLIILISILIPIIYSYIDYKKSAK